MKGLVGAAIALVWLVTPAAAQNYIGAQLGASLLSDAKFDDGLGLDKKLTYDTGWSGTLFAGTGVAPNIRAEAELGYSSNPIDERVISGVGTAADGDVSAWSLMANLIYDVPLAPGPRLYGLIGLGFARISINDFAIGGTLIADDSDTSFAWQAGAGVEYPVTPTAFLQLDFRYFSATSFDYNLVGGTSISSEYDRKTIRAGVRVRF